MTAADLIIAASERAAPICPGLEARTMFGIAWCESANLWEVARNWMDVDPDTIVDSLACLHPMGKDSGEAGPWQIRPIYFVDAWEAWKRYRDKLRAATPCSHPGCHAHVSHPCEQCGQQWESFADCEPNMRSVQGQAFAVAWYLRRWSDGTHREELWGAVYHYGPKGIDAVIEADWPEYVNRFFDGIQHYDRLKGATP
jgi:hypothetical protein